MNVYSIGVTIHATMYIKAETEAEAYQRAREFRDSGLELQPDEDQFPPISGKQYSDPDLPDVSLSPAMTLADPEPIEQMELAEELDAPEFDNTIAANEGWVVSDCYGSDNGPWQLQKIDEDNTFASDEEAWLFVHQKAEQGSAYHKAALDFLREHNPAELACITQFVALKENRL